MATTKKAAAAALKTLDLTKRKNDDGGKLKVEGLERMASEYRDAQAEIELLLEAQKQRRAEILAVCTKKRSTEERAGRFYKTCAVVTDTDDVLNVSWGDKYKALDVSHEPVLRKAFGKHYDDLFGLAVTAKIDKDATVEQIREIVGPSRLDALTKMVRFSESLKLRSGFMEARADLRPAFDDQTNDSIDTVVGQIQSDPSLKVVAAKEDA